MSEDQRSQNQTTPKPVTDKARQIDPWAWTSHAFGTSDRELYLALKARREASVKAAEKELAAHGQ